MRTSHTRSLGAARTLRGACCGVLVLLTLGATLWTGCQARQRQRPVRMGPVDAGPGSLEFERRQLEGTWELQALFVTAPDGSSVQVPASARLTYDMFGNLALKGTIDGPLPTGAHAGAAQALDYEGQVAIDPDRHEMRLVKPQTADALEATTPDARGRWGVRRYLIDDDLLTITILNDSGAAIARVVFRRARAPS